MRTLSRPMFKMGGPIKEGIMHGIREPYKGGGAALVGNPLYPKTDGREHHFKYLKDIPKYIKPGYWTSGWTNPGTLGGRIAGGIKNIFKPRPMNTVYTPFKSPTTGGRIKNWLETSKAGKYIKGTPEGRLTGWGLTAGKGIIPKIAKAALKSPTATLGGAYMLDAFPGGEPLLNLDVLGNRNVLFQRYDPKTNKRIKGTGISSFWEDEENLKKEIKKNLKELPSVKKVLTDAEKKLIEDTKLKNAKAARDKRVNNLLEIMGYDKSKNDAVSKALIDASQIIGERGTLSKKNITRELINPIIAATGKRLEKPEQIREAVGLMMAKGEIEKDIFKSKRTASEQAIDALAAASGKSAKYIANAKLGIANSPAEAKAQLAKLKNTRITSDNLTAVIQQYADENNIPFKKQITTDQKNEVVGKGKKYASIVDMITDMKLDVDGADDGLYVVGTSIIEVTGGLPKLKG